MRSLISYHKPKSTISEQYRTLRTNIQFSNVDRNIRSVMVTSSFQEEGKSTTAANLAVVYAQQGKRVLFVDADLRKPTVQYTFQLENHIGLTNVLTKQTELNSAVQQSAISNLWILTSGPIPPNPAELLGSQAMESLLVDMYNQFDLIVFDTPPVLPIADAHILANQCDGIVLVMKSGAVEKDAALKAKDILENAAGKLLGVVLNQKKQQEDGQYYYYYGTK
ncbi:CpsD/CapB family tyrosine-protein kinase [Priestia megaterium]|uniref:CpsD/CapB family tyrosine-protein kinase n=1 Tax=Priestia megaterium TaxID=1404 RepID=UPI0022B8C854|nr:CpsD/CapB family tyrosine-protein kinase [Priestia megaterium]MCZ8493366.1 CpsD/CapB family tyrosine-protein kinase [Priestia megaterium]